MVNVLAIIVASIVSMALGMLWYGPLFGKKWIELMGLSKTDLEKSKKKGMTATFVISFVSTLVMAAVLAYLLQMTGNVTAIDGAVFGFIIWLGFLATTLINPVLWESKPWGLYILNGSHYLIALIIIGLILGTWN